MGKARIVAGSILMAPFFILVIPVVLIPSWLLRVVFRSPKAAYWWMTHAGRPFPRILCFCWGIKVVTTGKENLPAGGRVCYISNHQSMVDVIATLAGPALMPGMVAKREMKFFPVVNWWCVEIHSIFIDRGSPKSAIRSILKGVEQIKGGNPVLIYPEGTRSKTGEIGRFKAGSFALATRSGAKIVPITVYGSRRALEDRTRWGKVVCYLDISPAIDCAGLSKEEKKQIPDRVESVIRDRYEKLKAAD